MLLGSSPSQFRRRSRGSYGMTRPSLTSTMISSSSTSESCCCSMGRFAFTAEMVEDEALLESRGACSTNHLLLVFTSQESAMTCAE